MSGEIAGPAARPRITRFDRGPRLPSGWRPGSNQAAESKTSVVADESLPPRQHLPGGRPASAQRYCFSVSRSPAISSVALLRASSPSARLARLAARLVRPALGLPAGRDVSFSASRASTSPLQPRPGPRRGARPRSCGELRSSRRLARAVSHGPVAGRRSRARSAPPGPRPSPPLRHARPSALDLRSSAPPRVSRASRSVRGRSGPHDLSSTAVSARCASSPVSSGRVLQGTRMSRPS